MVQGRITRCLLLQCSYKWSPSIDVQHAEKPRPSMESTFAAPTHETRPVVYTANCQSSVFILELARANATESLMWHLHYEICTTFGQLILRKIIKIVASICQILRLKCTNIQFRLGFCPNPAGRVYSASPVSLAGFKKAYF